MQQSDCAQCTLDGTCTCLPLAPGTLPRPGNASCCQKKAARATGAGATVGAANQTGFATIALSRSGYAGREHDTGAQLLRATAPEARVVLDGVAYDVGGLVGQIEFAFLNTTLLDGFRSPAGAFQYRDP